MNPLFVIMTVEAIEGAGEVFREKTITIKH